MANRGINKVILVGNLGQDPEVRYMPNGSAVANFSVATSESWKDKQTSEQKYRTEWHRVVVFGKLAEIAGEYVKKERRYIWRVNCRVVNGKTNQDKIVTLQKLLSILLVEHCRF